MIENLDQHDSITCTENVTMKDDGVGTFMRQFHKQWVSILPGISSLALHVSRIMGSRIDVTIIEQDQVAARLVKILSPEVSVGCYDITQLYNMLELPILPCETRTRKIKGGICYNLFDSPLAQAQTSIFGIDITIRTKIAFPIQTTRPKEFSMMIELIHRFIKHRSLQCFFLIVTPTSNTPPNDDDIDLMFSDLVGWKFVTETVDCAEIGDPISAHRAIIIGIHPKAVGMTPNVSISERTATRLETIADHLNINLNTKLCSLAEVNTESLNETNSQCHHRTPRPLAIARSKGVIKLDNRDIVFRTAYPGVECDGQNWTAERQSFLIAFTCSLTSRYHIRALHSSEMLALYTSGTTQDTRQRMCEEAASANICPWLSGSCPWHTGKAIAEYLVDIAIAQDRVCREDVQEDVVRCNVVQPVPTAEKWSEAYRDDKETNYIITRLKNNEEWQERELLSVHRAFRPVIRENRLRVKAGRLVMISPIAESSKFLTLIVVQKSLRTLIFQAYHCTGVGGHVGSYKTLLILRVRFFWPHMRSEILSWVQQCAGCIPTTVRRRENTGIIMSWPLSKPFSIISVDLWSPGKTTSTLGYKNLMNCMCDMCQFVISVPVKQTTAAYLARL